jgi:hypothetical protein
VFIVLSDEGTRRIIDLIFLTSFRMNENTAICIISQAVQPLGKNFSILRTVIEMKLWTISGGGILEEELAEAWIKTATPRFAAAGFRFTGIYLFISGILPETVLAQSVRYTAASTETTNPHQELKIRNGLQLIKKLRFLV